MIPECRSAHLFYPKKKNDKFSIVFSTLQANGHRKPHTTTSLTIDGDDEMIDITPRETNFSNTMTTDGGYNRQTSPVHSAFSRERDRDADVDGELYIYINRLRLHSSCN